MPSYAEMRTFPWPSVSAVGASHAFDSRPSATGSTGSTGAVNTADAFAPRAVSAFARVNAPAMSYSPARATKGVTRTQGLVAFSTAGIIGSAQSPSAR